MDFPVWQNGAFGGGFTIILVAVLHVFVAYFAVGGGLFLVATEMRARRSGSPALMAYLKRHTRFFLLLTMVFGALSGVGIWLVIAVLSPQATLVLVRTFVWAWAAEWTFFAGEIAALLIYSYGFERLGPRWHMLVGLAYFVFAFLSLFAINGIIGFMLTPGQWPTTLNFWDGIFNPSFWPSLVLRFALGVLLAGLFGLATALGIGEEAARESTLRASCRWVIAGAVFMLVTGGWYVGVLPPEVREFFLRRSTELASWHLLYPGLVVALAALAFVLVRRTPHGLRRLLAVVLLLMGLGLVGTFETFREAARKPWLIHGLLWSTDIRPDQTTAHDAAMLPRMRWAGVKELTPENTLVAGRALFAAQCLACHSIGGPIRDIRRYTGDVGPEGLTALITGQGKLFHMMPPFLGSLPERRAVAAYIDQTINGHKPAAAHAATIEAATADIPSFAPDSATHVLLAFANRGMVALAGCDGSFSLALPQNGLAAILLKRDVMPEVVTKDVDLTYAAPEWFKHPARRLEFWKYAKSLVGRELADGVSTTGLSPDGVMTVGEKVFAAHGIPVTPYPEQGGVNPYPVFTVTAKDAKTGKVLAQTKAVLPVSTEMGCYRCHGGSYGVDGVTGVSERTAGSILAVHDRRNGTSLVKAAASGKPVACQSCHVDAQPAAGGKVAERLGLSAAIHGFHASYLAGSDNEACTRCHPADPHGITQAQRDSHAAAGIGCTRCHGLMEDHALSLLLREKEAGKKAAEWLIKPLTPRAVAAVADIHPRTAWTQEPDCLTCHKGFIRPDPAKATAFNTWTKDAAGLFVNRREDTGNVPCAACHGSPHATFVAVNDYGLDINNIASMQYMGNPGVIGSGKRCDVCHTVEMEGGEAHHPNMQQ